ncbi:MAG: DUF3575 domain-containing protein [Prevotellaceae bacterium]|jgi:hypothetical protein|nr:DUF3575 domain-containing protein [Prevotellaceae bacterium]
MKSTLIITAVFVLMLPPLAGALGQEQYPAYKIALGAENRCAFAVKTNLLLLGIDAIANAGGELFLPAIRGRYFSIDVSFIYSPYMVARNWKFRALAVQPELRWWIRKKQPAGGHFLGVHAHVAWYNVSTNRSSYYQDRDGRTPLWGAGVSYGYAVAVPGWDRCSMEFTLGAGYARLDYDVFYNVPNGAKYAGAAKNYWGLTRAGLSFSYYFK